MNKFWVTIIVILVVAGGAWWVENGSTGMPSILGTSASPTGAAYKSKTPVPVVHKNPTATPVPTQSLSYTQLVAQYGTNRIQFDRNCQAQPTSVVFKNGTSILLDNRSAQDRTITVDGKGYTLGAYGYQVITLSSPSVPKTISLGCNSSVNVGTIQLQANISGQ